MESPNSSKHSDPTRKRKNNQPSRKTPENLGGSSPYILPNTMKQKTAFTITLGAGLATVFLDLTPPTQLAVGIVSLTSGMYALAHALKDRSHQ